MATRIKLVFKLVVVSGLILLLCARISRDVSSVEFNQRTFILKKKKLLLPLSITRDLEGCSLFTWEK